jgi:hypothetical protein
MLERILWAVRKRSADPSLQAELINTTGLCPVCKRSTINKKARGFVMARILVIQSKACQIDSVKETRPLSALEFLTMLSEV